MDQNERLRNILTGREIPVRLQRALLLRVQAWMDRYNHSVPAEDRYSSFDEDDELQVAICVLVEDALDRAEEAAGLTGTVFGELMSKEVVDEARRRRREERDA